jgi:hypothetical protein
MPTKAELQKQVAAIEAGLLDFTTVGEASYFKKTGQTKLTEKAVPKFSELYNPEFEKTKKIQFTMGADPKTRAKADTAFYVFNPAIEAEKKAQQIITSTEQHNKAVTEQQKQIQTFLASEKETAKQTVLQNYLSSILNPQLSYGQLNPFEYETIDINTTEGWNRWRNTPRNMQVLESVYDQQGRRTQLYNYKVKLTPDQIAEKKKTTEAIERVRFMSSPTLQKTYAEKYRQQLLAQIRTMK